MPKGPDQPTILQSEGTRSRVLNFGTSSLVHAAANMLPAAGCALDDWQASADAWEPEWEMEDGVRTAEELAAIMIHLGA
jgi:hypothetical protein